MTKTNREVTGEDNAPRDSGMPYAVSLQISAEDYRALVAHFAKPETERMGRPLVAVNKVLSACGWEADIKAAQTGRES
jgi:hypothetical protein